MTILIRSSFKLSLIEDNFIAGFTAAFQLDAAVRLTDPSCVLSSINRQRRSDPLWPSDDIRKLGGASGWDGWSPKENSEGMWLFSFSFVILSGFCLGKRR